MGYDIERRGADKERHPIPLAEWQAAVEEVPGIRLALGPAYAANPKTGEIISIPSHGGDAEIYFAADDEWQRVFFWSPDGAISLRADADSDRPDDEIWTFARTLGRKLNAIIVGNEGEIYP